MGLLTEFLTRTSSARAVQLTNPDNPGGIKATTLSGTATVTNGSAAVVGVATSFTSFGTGIVIQFSSQPGVNYVVSAITDATHLTLAQSFTGVTTAGVTGYLPSINYVVLQQAVYDAQAHFQARTNYAFDDVTTNANTTPLTLNKCIWAGISVVIAYLYEYRGMPEEAQAGANAWKSADRRLEYVLHNYGDGAWAQPYSDSVFQPSVGPTRLPNFDTARFGNLDSQNPGPGMGGSANVGTSEY